MPEKKKQIEVSIVLSVDANVKIRDVKSELRDRVNSPGWYGIGDVLQADMRIRKITTAKVIKEDADVESN